MAADDFFWQISFNSLRAEVPAGDLAFGAQQINRVVGDALHEKPELLLALTKLGFSLPAFGQIAGNLGKSDELSIAVADRIDNDVSPKFRAVLPNTPSFVLELSLTGCSFECTLRQAGSSVFIGIEVRKMPADNFGGFVAFE